MNRTSIGTLIVLLLTGIANGQQVCLVTYPHQADVRVIEVPYVHQADLLVYQVRYPHQAVGNQGHWYIQDSYPCWNGIRIWFTHRTFEADLKVHFVSHAYQAGWRNAAKSYLFSPGCDRVP